MTKAGPYGTDLGYPKKQSTRITMGRKQSPLTSTPGTHPGWHLPTKKPPVRISPLSRSEASSDSDYSSDEVRATNKSGLLNHSPKSYFQPPKKKK